MKILHTSDWHLGRTFHGRLLDDAQASVAEHLIECARSERVDAVLISGDVYDRGVPPREAVSLFSQTLRRLTEFTRVIVTSGNHDDASRLGFAASLFRPELAVRTRVEDIATPVVVPDAHGGAGAYVYTLPYLHPDVARYTLAPLVADEAQPGPSSPASHQDGTGDDAPQPLARSHEAVIGAAMRLVAADLAHRRSHDATRVPAIVMAHAFVVGGSASESERDIQVGGVDSVSAEVLATCGGSERARAAGGLDYVALGHLHSPQEITTGSPSPSARLVYPGSPLAFSFSEASRPKSWVLLEVGSSGLTRLERIPVPAPHPIATLTGTVDELLAQAGGVAPGTWLRLIVRGPMGPGDTASLRHALGDVLAIQREDQPHRAPGAARVTRQAHPLQVSTRFLTEVGQRPLTQAEELVLSRAYEAVIGH